MDTHIGPDDVRVKLRKDQSYFTVQEMIELLSMLDRQKIADSVTNQICKDMMTFPYYDALAMWFETEQWRSDNSLCSTFAWLFERQRYSDVPALVKTRGFGKRFREVMKLKRIPKPVEKMIVSRLSLGEALWRIRNPKSDKKALRSFLLDQITKLESD